MYLLENALLKPRNSKRLLFTVMLLSDASLCVIGIILLVLKWCVWSQSIVVPGTQCSHRGVQCKAVVREFWKYCYSQLSMYDHNKTGIKLPCKSEQVVKGALWSEEVRLLNIYTVVVPVDALMRSHLQNKVNNI